MTSTKCKYNRETRKGEHAILVEHSATGYRGYDGEPVCFDFAIPVRTFKIKHPTRYPQSVGIWFKPPRRHDWYRYEVLSDNLTYYTIESEIGMILFDSRQDVPCDMAAFTATKTQSVQSWQEKGYTVIVEEFILCGFTVKVTESEGQSGKVCSIELWRDGRNTNTLAPFYDREKAIKEIPAFVEREMQFAH